MFKMYHSDPIYIFIFIEKFKLYKFTKKDLDGLWKLLEEHIMNGVMAKFRDKKKNRVVRGAVNVPKCNDAKYAGKQVIID